MVTLAIQKNCLACVDKCLSLSEGQVAALVGDHMNIPKANRCLAMVDQSIGLKSLD